MPILTSAYSGPGAADARNVRAGCMRSVTRFMAERTIDLRTSNGSPRSSPFDYAQDERRARRTQIDEGSYSCLFFVFFASFVVRKPFPYVMREPIIVVANSFIAF